MNKRHYEHTLPNIRGSLSNTYRNETFCERYVIYKSNRFLTYAVIVYMKQLQIYGKSRIFTNRKRKSCLVSRQNRIESH